MKKVFIGVGHGGTDSGAVAANGLKEKDLNLSIALACDAELKRHGVKTQLSRYTDEADSISEEIKECNAYKPDVAVDIHNNAGGGAGDGCEVFYSIAGGTGKTLAYNINAGMLEVGQNSRGIKTKKTALGKDYYAFIRETSAPAVIVECAFVDNKTDIAIIDTAAEQKAMGAAIAKGILKTLNIAYKPTEETAGNVIYKVQIGSFKLKSNAEKMREKARALGFTDAYITTK